MHMHGESYTMQQIRRKRERGQRMANARWKQDRERREELSRLEAIDPLIAPGRILQRVIVITDEREVKEIVRRNNTSAREWARLKKKAGL